MICTYLNVLLKQMLDRLTLLFSSTSICDQNKVLFLHGNQWATTAGTAGDTPKTYDARPWSRHICRNKARKVEAQMRYTYDHQKNQMTPIAFFAYNFTPLTSKIARLCGCPLCLLVYWCVCLFLVPAVLWHSPTMPNGFRKAMDTLKPQMKAMGHAPQTIKMYLETWG